jgi:hypothetical protein
MLMLSSTRLRALKRIGVAAVLVCASVGSMSAQGRGPTPEHKKLEVFVGAWSFEGESKAVPELGMNDAGKISYRHVNTMINGGFYLETRRTGTNAQGPLTELFVYSYDPLTKMYRQDAYDSRGRVRTFSATVQGLTWSFTGVNTSADGKVTKERYTLTYSADMTSATLRSEHSRDGAVWYERTTGTYRKLPGTAAGR